MNKLFDKVMIKKLYIQLKNNIIKFPSAPSNLSVVEAILFAASEPLDIETIEKGYKQILILRKF